MGGGRRGGRGGRWNRLRTRSRGESERRRLSYAWVIELILLSVRRLSQLLDQGMGYAALFPLATDRLLIITHNRTLATCRLTLPTTGAPTFDRPFSKRAASTAPAAGNAYSSDLTRSAARAEEEIGVIRFVREKPCDGTATRGAALGDGTWRRSGQRMAANSIFLKPGS